MGHGCWWSCSWAGEETRPAPRDPISRRAAPWAGLISPDHVVLQLAPLLLGQLEAGMGAGDLHVEVLERGATRGGVAIRPVVAFGVEQVREAELSALADPGLAVHVGHRERLADLDGVEDEERPALRDRLDVLVQDVALDRVELAVREVRDGVDEVDLEVPEERGVELALAGPGDRLGREHDVAAELLPTLLELLAERAGLTHVLV